MKLDAYWTDSAPAFRPQARDLPPQVDVAVVGGGFTGLSAALALAKRGASVAVLEAGERVAAEASGRNGGHVNNGLAVDYAEVAAKVGVEQRAPGTTPTTPRSTRWNVSCATRRSTATSRAAASSSWPPSRRTWKRCRAAPIGWWPTASTPTCRSCTRPRVRAEVASERFVGGLLYKRSGQMHMGRFADGLAQAAERHGAQIHTATCVQRLERLGGGPQGGHAHRVHTNRGTVRAQQVLLATGAARHGGYASFGWLRRRIVPIGSFIVVTEPLGEERAMALLRERRTYVTVANIHHYFRLTPDHRLVFGGRARFAMSQPGVGREERRHPARRHGRNLSAAAGRRASTTAGAAWWT